MGTYPVDIKSTQATSAGSMTILMVHVECLEFII